MAAEIVMAVYRAKPGKDDDLAALLDRHQAVLREAELVTDRSPVVMRSPEDGTFIEVFEWRSREAACAAHEHAPVGELWQAMAEVADFLTLADVPEAIRTFPHFTPWKV